MLGVTQPLTFSVKLVLVCSLTKSSFLMLISLKKLVSHLNFLDSDPNKPVASAYSNLCNSALFLIHGGIYLICLLCFIFLFLYFIYHCYWFEVCIALEYELSHLVQKKCPFKYDSIYCLSCFWFCLHFKLDDALGKQRNQKIFLLTRQYPFFNIFVQVHKGINIWIS